MVLANAAAVAACGVAEAALSGRSLKDLTGDAQLVDALIAQAYRLPVSEVQVGGQRFLMETVALHEPGGSVAGAVLTLHAPQRLGERISALQNYSAGGFEAILGQSPAIRQLKQRAARMAQVDAPLLIPRRKPAPARSWLPTPAMRAACAAISRFLRSTVRPCPRAWPRASCLAMRPAPSPARCATVARACWS